MTPKIHRILAALAAVASLVATAAVAQGNSGPAPANPTVTRKAEQPLYGESHALVIGASKYTAGWPDLPGVAEDVAAVAKLLGQQGFKVTVVNNPGRDQLDAALRSFAAGPGQKADNRLLVYFAGHGHTITTGAGSRLGYIVPIDAPLPARDPGGFRRQAYSMENVEVIARGIESRHVLFLFDSCFSGTIFRSRGGVPESISDKMSRPVRQFITAGDADQLVPDESIFRRQLETALRDGAADLNHDGYITGTELGLYLEDTVTNYSHRAQTPRWGKIRDPDLDKGDFVFALAASQQTASPPPPPPPAYEAPTSAGVAGFRDCADCPEMVVIDAGSFSMGSPESETGHPANEGPQHMVTLAKPFALGRYEVTVGEFERFVAASNYLTEAERNVGHKGCYAWDDTDNKWEWREGRNWRSPGFVQTKKHPAVCVSWNDAQAYLSWFTQESGHTYRLPSEAEWEYAARAGSTTSRPWGEDPGQACRYANGADQSHSPRGNLFTAKHNCNDGSWATAPVGSFLENRFGLYDMLGNAWEWVQDVWHDNYSRAPADGSPWVQSGNPTKRVLRGGAWDATPKELRSTTRSSQPANHRDNDIGFRLARNL